MSRQRSWRSWESSVKKRGNLCSQCWCRNLEAQSLGRLTQKSSPSSLDCLTHSKHQFATASTNFLRSLGVFGLFGSKLHWLGTYVQRRRDTWDADYESANKVGTDWGQLNTCYREAFFFQFDLRLFKRFFATSVSVCCSDLLFLPSFQGNLAERAASLQLRREISVRETFTTTRPQ